MSARQRRPPSGLRLWIRRLQTEAGRQTSVLYGAQLTSSVLSFLLTAALTRTLSFEEYGVYAFCMLSVITILALPFEFGLFAAGARLLAVAKDRDQERRTLGAIFAAGIGVGALFSIAVAVSGPIVDHYYGFHVAHILFAVSPLAAAIPLVEMTALACQGTNRIGALALLRLAVPISGLAFVGLLVVTHEMTPLPAIASALGGMLLAVGLVALLLKPSFEGLGEEMRHLFAATREFGVHFYVGRVITMMSNRLDAMLIPLYVGTSLMGIYGIAQQLSNPLVSLARSIAMTRFKAFANRDEVSWYIIRWNAMLLGAAVLGLVAVGPLAVHVFLSDKYQAVIPLILPFGLMALFGGLLQPYNMFLSAHGRGREMRSISFVMGITNVVGLLTVIPLFKLGGAAWWAAGSAAFNFLLYLYYYRKVRKSLV